MHLSSLPLLFWERDDNRGVNDMTDTTDPKPSALTFPCEFVIKVFGVATDLFENQILDIIRTHCPELHPSAVRSRPSKDGKYLALSITVHVESQKELDDIYYELTACPFVLMAL
jgi:putative lipoic acid-binding regulatory protein